MSASAIPATAGTVTAPGCRAPTRAGSNVASAAAACTPAPRVADLINVTGSVPGRIVARVIWPLLSICASRYGRPPTVLADRRSEVRCVLHLLEIAPARI
jgi:hypothetical protein